MKSEESVFERAFRQLEQLASRSTFLDEFLDDGLVDTSRRVQVGGGESDKSSQAVLTDNSQELRTVIKRYLDAKSGVDLALIEGRTGTGKSCVLAMLQHEINKTRKDSGKRIISTGIINCGDVHHEQNSSIVNLVWTIAESLAKDYCNFWRKRLDEEDGRQVHSALESLIKCCDFPQHREEAKREWASLQKLEECLAVFGRLRFRIIIILDEFSNCWLGIPNDSVKLDFVMKFWQRIPDSEQLGSHHILLVTSVLEEHYDIMVKDKEGRETGAYRRTNEARLILKDLSAHDRERVIRVHRGSPYLAL